MAPLELGAKNLEADLRRTAIDRDLDQPDIASPKVYEEQTDSDIVSAFRQDKNKKSEGID